MLLLKSFAHELYSISNLLFVMETVERDCASQVDVNTTSIYKPCGLNKFDIYGAP